MQKSNAIADLLIQFEYHKEIPTKSSIAKPITGILLFATGIVAIILGVLPLFLNPSDRSLPWPVLAGGAISIPGIWLAISGMSDYTFARWNKVTKWLSPKLTLIASGSTSIIALICSTFFAICWIVLDHNDKSTNILLIQSGILTVSMTTVCLFASQGPIQIGTAVNQSRFKSQVQVVNFELISLLGPLVASMTVLASVGGAAWIPAALTGIALLITYRRHRINQIGEAFNEAIRLIEQIRQASVSSISSCRSEKNINYHDLLLKAYRALHLSIVSHPSFKQRGLTSYPLICLCMAVELRRENSGNRADVFTGPNRKEAVNRVLYLSEAEFAKDSKEVSTALIYTFDRSLVPGFKKINDKDGIEQIMKNRVLTR